MKVTLGSRSAALFAGVLYLTACGGPPPPAAPPPVVDELVVTPAAMANFVAAFVAKETQGAEYMNVTDSVTGTAVKLKLQPMQSVPMNPLGMGIFASCVPMADESGAVWDVDFVSQKTDRGMSFVEAGIHKTPTESRYEWVKNEREIWEKRTGS